MYLGNTPATSFETVRKQVSTSNSGTTITLDFPVTNVQDILVTVDAVIQSYDNYSVSANTLTLNGTLNNNRVEILYVGRTFQSVAPSDGSVTRDKLHLVSDGSNPSLIAKGTSGVSEGYIQLNCAENSHGVKIKSPPHSAGQSYTLTLPQSITNDTFLKTDGSGNLSFATTNTPAFLVKLSSNYNIATGTPTKLQYTTEVFDTDNAFDNSTNYRFTVPSGKAGKYFLYHQARANGWGAGRFVAYIYVNGSVDTATAENRTAGASYPSLHSSIVLDLDVGDYVEHYIYHDQGGTQGLQGFSSEHQSTTYFGGYRIGA